MDLSRIVATLALTAFLSSCAPEEEVRPLASVKYDVPLLDSLIPMVMGCWYENEDVACPVLIQQDGSLTHQGVLIDHSDIDAIEQSRFDRGISPPLTVAVHSEAEFSNVVDGLSALFPENAAPSLPARAE